MQRGQELILDLISRSLCSGAFPITAKFELQIPLNPLKRFGRESRINSRPLTRTL